MVLVGCQDSSDGMPTSAGAMSTSVSVGTSARISPAKDVAPWDPCALSSDAVRATGLDPDSKKTGVAGVEFDGWKVCRWRAQTGWYTLSILAGTPTLKDVQGRRDFSEFKPVRVGNRSALQFGRASDPDNLGCGVVVEVSGGTVLFDMLTRYGEPQQDAPCAVSVRHADELAMYLP
ncbi:DUF3558 domain-containing protein [Nocardia sp. XZ_19_369]|uniref:DUF3558 domain-containing protein n=1 Tax=Nocardia sp. XZ_19_369 TaxID=2769487 RepID=UPI0035A2AA70